MVRHGKDYHFIGEPRTGATARWGKTLDDDPPAAPWPELADISLSNRCAKGCTFCYKDSTPTGKLMSLDDYALVLDQLTHPTWGPVFQVALGGGEPLDHPQLFEILQETRRRGIIPNFTTSGYGLTAALAQRIAPLAGAVAVSVQDFEISSLIPARILTNAGVKTNLHFLLCDQSLADACAFLGGDYDKRLLGLNAVVFLTYKKTGRAKAGPGLTPGPHLEKFLALVAQSSSEVRFGFDACMVPPLLQKQAVHPMWVDSCECAFFSVYIDEELQVKPCSFAPTDEHTFSLKKVSFQEVWEGRWQSYRQRLWDQACTQECPGQGHCRGTCPFFPDLDLCAKEAKDERTRSA